jgi:ABC-type nitrate/sulfonate/bicarbonate transport system substrate-binding protein
LTSDPFEGKQIDMARIRILLLAGALLLSWTFAGAQEKKLQPLNVSYSSISGTRIPLWTAKELRLFEKYGLDAAPIHIASGSASYSALIAGDVRIVSDTASAAVAAAARVPIAIFGGAGPIAYKLIAHPSIASIDGLKGKIVGSSFVGAGSDFLLRRLMLKLGLTPGKDVQIIPTGVGRSDLRIQLIFQGKIDATLGSADNITRLEIRGQKVTILGDLADWGVVTTGGDFASTKQFLKENRPQAKAFLMAISEATAMARKNKEITFKVLRSAMRIEDPRILESMHKNYVLGTIPAKPYPFEGAIQTAIDEVSLTNPQLKGRRPEEFLDISILQELEGEGFFERIYR